LQIADLRLQIDEMALLLAHPRKFAIRNLQSAICNLQFF